MKAKANKPLRAAGILLLATMLTTCMTAGTFAKYTTSASGSDSARVAKFGVITQVDGTLFGEEYASYTDGDQPIGYSADTKTGTVQVNAQGTNDVVAPGTKNDTGLAVAVTGTPEVDVQVDTTIATQNIYLNAGSYATLVPNTKVTEENWTADTYYVSNDDGSIFTKDTGAAFDVGTTYYNLTDTFTLAKNYYPVVYSFDGITIPSNDDCSVDTLTTIANNLKARFKDANSIVQANTTLETKYDLGGKTLKWEWVFEKGSTDDEKKLYNSADTFLGNIAAKDDARFILVKVNEDNYTPVTETMDYSINTSFEFSITVTQID